MKPALFVASSAESVRLAHALQMGLTHAADVTVWDQGVFSLGAVTIDALAETVDQSDFGVFVFSPDDLVRLRNQETPAVRDNVLFEFGLFISKLGRKRVFMVLPDNLPSPIHLPTDLLGLTGTKYDSRKLTSDGNIQAVFGPPCFEIESAIKKEWHEPAYLTGDLVLLLRYLNRDYPAWMPVEYYVKGMAIFNGAPEQADQQISRGWKRCVRYQMLCLQQQRLAELNAVTAPMYRITDRGRRLLELLEGKSAYPRSFEHPIGAIELTNWGQQ